MVAVIKFIGNTYKTRANQRKKVVTSTGKISFIKIAKKAKAQRCHSCEAYLFGMKKLRPAAFSRLPVSQRRVSRAYGSTHCSNCVEKKIISAFLNEEQKIIGTNKN